MDYYKSCIMQPRLSRCRAVIRCLRASHSRIRVYTHYMQTTVIYSNLAPVHYDIVYAHLIIIVIRLTCSLCDGGVGLAAFSRSEMVRAQFLQCLPAVDNSLRVVCLGSTSGARVSSNPYAVQPCRVVSRGEKSDGSCVSTHLIGASIRNMLP